MYSSCCQRFFLLRKTFLKMSSSRGKGRKQVKIEYEGNEDEDASKSSGMKDS